MTARRTQAWFWPQEQDMETHFLAGVLSALEDFEMPQTPNGRFKDSIIMAGWEAFK